MREVTVKVFGFNELDEDLQIDIINKELAEVDFSDDIENYIDEQLSEMGLKEVTVGNFSMGDEETHGYLFLEGSFHEQLAVFEKHPASSYFDKISSAYVSEEEVTDDNQSGISVFLKEGEDYDSEETKKLLALFQTEFARIEEEILEKASEYHSKKSNDAVSQIRKVMSEFEFLADGTIFEKDMES